MKKQYVFVGSLPSAMMGVVSFTRFGQAADLSDEQARDLALGGSAIAPVADIAAAGITDQEWAKYGPFGTHAALPPDFAAKKQIALAACDAFRSQLTEVTETEIVKETV